MSRKFLRDRVPGAELLRSGHQACPACGGTLAMRLLLKGLGPDTLLIVSDSCLSILAGPEASIRVPLLRVPGGAGAAVAAAIEASHDAGDGHSDRVVCWADRAGTEVLGLPALLDAAARNEDLLYVCYDTEVPTGDPSGRPWPPTEGSRERFARADGGIEERWRGDFLTIMAERGIAAAATACVSFPDDLVDKVTKLRDMRGTRFLQILSPCPPCWGFRDDEAIELGRLAVRSRLFPLIEVEGGVAWRLTVEHRGDPVEPWFRKQERFRHLDGHAIARLQAAVDARWAELERRVAAGPAPAGE